jgi:type II secretory pathway component GspD/PulD (secretin)
MRAMAGLLKIFMKELVMKRILMVMLCGVSVVAFAQQRPSGARTRLDGPRMNSEEEAPVVEVVVDPVESGETGGQGNYDEIMGSFSKLATRFADEDEQEQELFVYECQYISAEAFGRAIEPFLSVNGELSDCEDADLVVITDDSKRLPRLKKIAEAIDRPVRQVLVSASVVEFQITDGFDKEVSLQYNQFKNLGSLVADSSVGSDVMSDALEDVGSRVLDAILPSDGTTDSLSGQSSLSYYSPTEQVLISGFMTFLEESGTAQILSSPSLIMRRGHTGSILSGEDIPITESNVGSGGTSYSVEYKSVGIKLQVTPESIFKDRVVLEVSPEVSNITSYEESGAGRNPVVAIRNASTKLEINDGYMVSIGGLIREEEIETVSRVPLLGNLPLVGWLFRATSSEKIRSQLVIFLSVKIVEPAALSTESIPREIPPELRAQMDAVTDSLPPQKSNLWTGIKNLFR